MVRKSRKSALEHYQVNAGGEYVYTGRYLKYRNEGKSRKRALAELWAVSLLMTGCTLACGCIPAPGMVNTFYVLLPLILEIILACTCIWSLGQATVEGDPMKEYVYQDSVEKLPGRFLGTAIFAAATILMELLFLLLSKEVSVLVVLVLILQVAALLLAILGRRGIRRIHWDL